MMALFLMLTLSACVSSGGTRIDEAPMYGGMDRSTIPELKQGDEEFIRGVTNEFGSREKAARIWVDKGFDYYKRDQLGLAMRRFNQAWLLDPNYSDVYWGFAAVLSDQEKHCEAASHMDTAFSKGGLQGSALADAGVIYSGCVASNPGLSQNQRNDYISKIDSSFKKALASPLASDKYVYYHWTRAMYAVKNWESAWEKANKYESVSGEALPAQFKNTIRRNLAK